MVHEIADVLADWKASGGTRRELLWRLSELPGVYVPAFFEPRYAIRQPDGGWGEFVADLEVVPIGGEHIQAIDEPYIAKVGAHMSEAIDRIQSEATNPTAEEK